MLITGAPLSCDVDSTAVWRFSKHNQWRYGEVKPDQSHNAAEMHQVESRGYFLPDKPSSVSESNPNSEDESESEDTSVVKKGRKYCFGEEQLHEFDG